MWYSVEWYTGVPGPNATFRRGELRDEDRGWVLNGMKNKNSLLLVVNADPKTRMPKIIVCRLEDGLNHLVDKH